MHIRKAKLSDTADMATVASNAMLDDEFVAWLCPRRRENFDSFRNGFLSRTKKRILTGFTVLVMVTDEEDLEWEGTEKVVGYLAMIREDRTPVIASMWDGELT
jgi:hypothetical protein